MGVRSKTSLITIDQSITVYLGLGLGPDLKLMKSKLNRGAPAYRTLEAVGAVGDLRDLRDAHYSFLVGQMSFSGAEGLYHIDHRLENRLFQGVIHDPSPSRFHRNISGSH